MSETNARRLIVEGVVIVLSILLAFAIDAWWSERQERIEEAEILLGLKQEFTDTRIVLEQQISKHSIMLQANIKLHLKRSTGFSKKLTIQSLNEFLN